jgi:hypothetical protein
MGETKNEYKILIGEAELGGYGLGWEGILNE